MILKNKPPLDLSNFTQDDLATSVFMTVDVQKVFACKMSSRGTKITDLVSKKIASLCPVFNQFGMDVAHVVLDHTFGGSIKTDSYRWPSPLHEINRKDHLHDLIYKDESSAFQATYREDCGRVPIATYLEDRKKKTLFMAGFNLTACVMATANDAIEQGYNIVYVSDLVANGHHFDEYGSDALAVALLDEDLIALDPRKNYTSSYELKARLRHLDFDKFCTHGSRFKGGAKKISAPGGL